MGGYHATIAQYAAEWGIAETCLCKWKYRGYRPFLGSVKPTENISRDVVYRSDSITRLRNMGPIRASPERKRPEIGLDVATPGDWSLNSSIFNAYKPKFTTSRHRTRSDTCIVACITVDFRSESATHSEHALHRKGGFLRCKSQCTNHLFRGESNMHQIVVTILCRLRPPFLFKGNWPFSGTGKPPPFLWEVLLLLQDLLYESTVFPHRGKR